MAKKKLPALRGALMRLAPNLRQALEPLLEHLEVRDGQRGDPLETAVTRRDLLEVGLVKTKPTASGTGAGGARPIGSVFEPVSPLPVMTTPPRVRNIVARGGLATIVLTWDAPGYANHAHVEVWRSAMDDVGQAVLVGTQRGRMYSDPVGAAGRYYYFLRNVSAAGVEGPWHGARGIFAETGKNPEYLLDVLQSQITASELHQSLAERIDLIDAPETGLVERAAQLEVDLSALGGELDTARLALTERISEAEAAALAEADTAGEAALKVLVAAEDGLDRVRALGLDFNTHRDATTYVDPASGQIRLYAVDELATLVGGSLNEVRAELDAVEGTLLLKAERTEVEAEAARITGAEVRLDGAEGSIASLTEEIALVDGRLTTAETSITQQGAAIELRATKTELDAAIAAVLEGFTAAASWHFNGTVEGWQSDGTLTAGDGVVTLDGAALYRTGLDLDGAENPIVTVRLRRLAGSTWAGALQWSNSAHGFEAANQRSIPEPAGLADFVTLQIGLREAGDWEALPITGLQLVFGAGEWEIDLIEVGKSSIEQLLFNDLDARMGAAEVRIDANEAAITLKASQMEVEGLEARLGAAELDIDAAEAAIALRATQTELAAVEDTLATRIGGAEVRLDAAEASIALKAEQLTVDAHGTRLSDAETRLDGAEASIALKASQAEVDDLGGRLDEAEVRIDAGAGQIAFSLRSLEELHAVDEQAGEAALEALLTQEGSLARERNTRARLASAEFGLEALSDELGAEASARLALSAALYEEELPAVYAAVAAESSARVSALEAEAAERSALAAAVTDPQTGLPGAFAAVAAESTARADADGALAEDISELHSVVTHPDTGLPAAHAAIVEERNARIGNNEVLAESIDQLQVAVYDEETGLASTYAAVQQKAEAQLVTDLEGEVVSLKAEYTIKLDVNGKVAGIGLAVDENATSAFGVLADQFWVSTGSADVKPFVIEGGNVYMDTAFIKDATIGAAKFGEAVLDNLTAAHGSLAMARIQKGDIFDLTIQNEIASEDYTPGQYGWKLEKNGTARFQGITIYDNNGNVVLASSSGLGALAYINRIPAANPSTYLEDAVIGTAQIKDAAVETLQLAGQAVTIPVGVYTAGTINVGGSWVTVQSASLTSTGAPIIVTLSCSSGTTAGGRASEVYMRVRVVRVRAGVSTVIAGPMQWAYLRASLSVFAAGNFSATIRDVPGEGAVTYQLQVVSDSGTIAVEYRTVVLLEVKR